MDEGMKQVQTESFKISRDSLRRQIGMDRLRDYIMNIVKEIDSTNFFPLEEYPMINSIKASGLKISACFSYDMENMLSYLSLSDGVITDDEILFINSVLGINASKSDIIHLFSEFSNPRDRSLSLICFSEYDIYLFKKESQNSNDGHKSPEFLNLRLLRDYFLFVGLDLIESDGNILEVEENNLQELIRGYERNVLIHVRNLPQNKI